MAIARNGVTLKDIADHLGISKMTVSAVLSGRSEGVFYSEATRQRVLEVARELGYRPNRTARALATGRTHVIALWMRYIHTSYFARAVHCLRQQVMQSQFEMIISGMRPTLEAEAGHPEFSDWTVDGILAYEGPEFVDAYLEAHRSTHPALVNLGCCYSERTDYVGYDFYPAALEAVQHLISGGARRVGYLVSQWGNHPGEARTAAYLFALQEAGIAPERIVVATSSRAEARAGLHQYVEEHGCPDALFCLCDDMALGAYRALYEMGRRIPEDVALVGCDGVEEIEYLECPISTIVPPMTEMCALAWTFLQRRIDAPSIPLQQAVLTPQLVIRESSRR